jgi:opacity protein-like surface antigen
MTKLLTLRGSVGYGFNENFATQANTTFTNLTFNTGLNYKLTRTMALDLYYDFNDFTTDSPGLSYTFSRNVVGIALTAQFR